MVSGSSPTTTASVPTLPDPARFRADLAAGRPPERLLRRLGILNPDALPGYSPLPVRNRAGDVVGQVEAVHDLINLDS